MAISSTQYIDLLFKSLSGVAKTDLPTNKSASNEAIASPLLNRGDQIWTEAGLIPTTAAAVSGVVQAYTGTGRAVATADNTAQAVGGVFPSWRTNLTNWIPPQFDTANITNTYRVKIYYGASGLSDPATSGGTQIFADGSGGTGEWYFDYASGVLNFIGGTIPSGMTGSSVIYVYGFRYVGKVGVTNLPAISASGTSTFSAITALSGVFTSTTVSTNTTTGALIVNGGVGIGGNTFVGGNLNAAGTITATTAFSGTLGTGGAQTINTNALTLSNYNDNGGILFFANSAGLISSNSANFRWNTSTVALEIRSTTSATSTTTGALVVTGGVGVGGDLFVNRTLDVLGTLASTSTVANNALYVAGGVGIDGSLYVRGPAVFQNDVIFSGTSTFVFSTQTVYTDNILNLHAPPGGVSGAWTVDDGKDVGFVFHNYKGVDNDSFLGWANDTGYLEWYSNGQETINGTFTNAIYGTFKTGGIILTYTTASNSTSTGALVVTGGVGIGGNLNVGGIIDGRVTNLSGGTAGQIPYQTATGVTSFFGPGTVGQILVSNGVNGPVYTNTGSIYVGQAVNADKWTTARTITFTGDTTGTFTIDGSASVTNVNLTIQPNSVALGADTTGDYVATGATSGFGLSGSSSGEAATFTVNSNATSSNVISTLVYRDGSGNFSAGTITAALTGNATSADKLSTARTISLSGDLGGSITFDGSTNVTLTATIQADSVALGSDTTGDYVASGATTGFGLSGSANSETATFTVGINSTSSNTTSTVVYRDENGNFSANSITANLVGIANSATNIAGGAIGSLPYQNGTGITVFLPLGLDGKVLQVSTATNSPIWGDIDGGTY